MVDGRISVPCLRDFGLRGDLCIITLPYPFIGGINEVFFTAISMVFSICEVKGR